MGLFNVFKKAATQAVTQAVSQAVQSTEKSSSSPRVEITATVNVETDVVPVEKRLKGTRPSSTGLYPHEILGLGYAPSFFTDQEEFQGFWWWSYGVDDVSGMLRSLEGRGYLRVGDVYETIANETVATLEEILKDNNAKQSGKKAELLDRIYEEVPESYLENLFPRRRYALTEKGEAELSANEAIRFAHRSNIEGLDIFSAPMVLDDLSEAGYEAAVWSYLTAKELDFTSAGRYFSLRMVKEQMACILAEKDDHKEALTKFAQSLYIDLASLGNDYSFDRYMRFEARSLFPYSESFAKIYPGNVETAFKYQEAAGLDDEEVRELMLASFRGINLPIQVFDDETCVDIYLLEKAGETAVLEEIYEEAERAFSRKYPKANLHGELWL